MKIKSLMYVLMGTMLVVACTDSNNEEGIVDILQVYWLSFNHKNMLNCGNVLYYCVLVSPIPYYIWYIQKAEREAKIQQSFRQILRGNEIYLARF